MHISKRSDMKKNKIILILVIAFLLPIALSAQKFKESIITPFDGEKFDLFGNSVSVYGDYAAVGAPWDDDKGIESGSVYIYKKINGEWTFKQKLNASDGGADDRFGNLFIQGDRLIVSGYKNINYGKRTGAVYEFKLENNNWIEKKKISPPDTIEDATFGCSVLLYKNYAIIGSFRDVEYGKLSGAVYIYLIKGDQWHFLKKINSEKVDYSDAFGFSVSMSDEYLAIGAPQDSTKNGIYAGSLYLYKQTSDTTWIKDTVLTAPSGNWYDDFGRATAINNLNLIVSASGNVYSTDPGRSYVYTNVEGKWIIEQVLSGISSYADHFGFSVSLERDFLLVGAPYAVVDGIRCGAAYFYQRVGGKWEESFVFCPSDGSEYDFFGSSVTVSDNILIGAHSKGVNDTGGVYFYTKVISELKKTDFIPGELVLCQNYPNPFNPTTTISYYLPEAGNLEIKVFDMLGREVVRLFDGYQSSGYKSINFNAASNPSGVYFCKLNYSNNTLGESSKTIKMTLFK